jgi:hypothetical protein
MEESLYDLRSNDVERAFDSFVVLAIEQRPATVVVARVHVATVGTVQNARPRKLFRSIRGEACGPTRSIGGGIIGVVAKVQQPRKGQPAGGVAGVATVR